MSKEQSDFIKLLYSMYPQLKNYYLIKKTDKPEDWVEEITVSTCPMGTDTHRKLKWKKR